MIFESLNLIAKLSFFCELNLRPPARLSDAQENDSYMTNFLRDTTGS